MTMELDFPRRRIFNTTFSTPANATGASKPVYQIVTSRTWAFFPDKTTIMRYSDGESQNWCVVAEIIWNWPSQDRSYVHYVPWTWRGILETYTWRSYGFEPTLYDAKGNIAVTYKRDPAGLRPPNSPSPLGHLKFSPEIAQNPSVMDAMFTSFFIFKTCRDVSFPWQKKSMNPHDQQPPKQMHAVLQPVEEQKPVQEQTKQEGEPTKDGEEKKEEEKRPESGQHQDQARVDKNQTFTVSEISYHQICAIYLPEIDSASMPIWQFTVLFKRVQGSIATLHLTTTSPNHHITISDIQKKSENTFILLYTNGAWHMRTHLVLTYNHSMPVFRKSPSSKQSINILPYLRSASSKLSLSALSSTSSIGALFTSSSPSTSGSSRSLFKSGTRGKDKENTSPTPSPSSKDKSKKGKKKSGGSAYPEISAPQLTPDSLEAVKARFTLIPLAKSEPCVEDETDVVIVSEVDYYDMPISISVPQIKRKASRAV
ncbi:uncharacterized protein FOMMEDRAFT_28209 [Fomitiporia mediterranea MF3/22]|uniref:uncharacterized protein n=1 Tax=Fomitiporia mediterranea (strain MF3/22) TaxID=694068 RepID=UPI0004407986|nr:uncharacterized protein FOMMEDRAFT_28209 [Fomitiporia mediterranea MF3/22]EJD04536.1 hypothetical protein FOMMEDRAFT_28209 [Fomitiporia mediterranea MF3/22]